MSDFTELQLDSNLVKDASQVIQPQGAVYASANPSTPANSPNGYTQPGGAPDVITATVITSCIIQTSALPSRAELSGNDLTFFDDTTTQNGKVTGDTSRIVFTHNSGKEGATISQGFILEKRASTINSYDNVLSLYAYPATNDPTTHANTMNYIFIGLQGSFGDPQYNVNVIEFIVNHDSANVTKPSQNGEFNIAGSINGAQPLGVNIAVQHNSLLGVAGDGFSVFIAGSGTGVVEIGSQLLVTGAMEIGGALKVDGAVTVGGSIIPDTDNAYDLGSASSHFRNLYVAGTIAPHVASAGPVTGTTISATISIGVGAVVWVTGTGTPNGTVTAPAGSLYTNTAGGAGTTLYVKESGAGNTGWIAK